jgi:nucleoside-diphosphate-sugar epimerase
MLIFEKIRTNKKPKVFLKDNVLRTLIYTPDASKATALIGNTPETFGQTWHLPCDDNRLTYSEILKEISKQLNRTIKYDILNSFALKVASFFSANIKETQELLPRYAIDNLFDSSKFKNRFPHFKVTSYQEGIKHIIDNYQLK